jgi:hypothetical protein
MSRFVLHGGAGKAGEALVTREDLCNTRNTKAAPERATVFQIILSFGDLCVGSPSRSSRPQGPPSLSGLRRTSRASADKSGFRPASLLRNFGAAAFATPGLAEPKPAKQAKAGGRGRTRTYEGIASGFTVRPLCRSGHSPPSL